MFKFNEMNMEPIVNKVAQSGIIVLNLADYKLPVDDFIVFDLKDYLFKELLLREKDFREVMKNLDWSMYANKYVSVICSSDAIVPMWAYMLIGSYLQEHASYFAFKPLLELKQDQLEHAIKSIPVEDYTDARIIIKGCGDTEMSPNAFLAITALLKPVVKSLMYGEPCSSVPIYKKK